MTASRTVGGSLLTRYGRLVGHLSLGAPGWGSTGVHEGGFYLPPPTPDRVVPGCIPTVSMVGDTLADHADELEAICREAMQRPR